MKSDAHVVPPWQVRRTEWSHHWLKNSYFQDLTLVVRVLEGKVRSNQTNVAMIGTLLRRWPPRAADLRQLIKDFESAMSPASLLERPRFAGLRSEVKHALHVALHQAWLRKHGVGALQTDVLLALDRATTAADQLHALNSTDADPLPAVKQFRNALAGLSEAVHRLPSEILIP